MRLQQLEFIRDGLADPMPFHEARDTWRNVRSQLGLAPTNPRLLTHPRGNTKLNKGGQYGLCLLPHRLAGVGNLCPHSTRECRRLCINLSGRGNMPFVQIGRKARTVLLVQHPRAFSTLFMREIKRLPVDASVRLNVYSDLNWENLFPQLFTTRSDINWYDYTKAPVGSRVTPSNYSLTYSVSEKWSEDDIIRAVHGGDNVTVVLNLRRKEAMPTEWNSLPVIDGDVNDARYLDPVGVVVGLRSKGKAFGSDSPFVRGAV